MKIIVRFNPGKILMTIMLLVLDDSWNTANPQAATGECFTSTYKNTGTAHHRKRSSSPEREATWTLENSHQRVFYGFHTFKDKNALKPPALHCCGRVSEMRTTDNLNFTADGRLLIDGVQLVFNLFRQTGLQYFLYAALNWTNTLNTMRFWCKALHPSAFISLFTAELQAHNRFE